MSVQGNTAIQDIADLLDYCTPDELAEIDMILAEETPVWVPLPGPQTQAYNCEADILYYGGCVPAETEFLTHDGWKRIGDYRVGDCVYQWDAQSKRITPALPSAFVDQPCKEFICFEHSRLSMVLSPDHRMPLYDYEGKFVVKRAHEIEQNPSRYKVPVQFIPSGSGIDLSDDMIRLSVAVYADGNLTVRKRKPGAYCRVTLRKDRKKDRLVSILKRLGIEWHEYRNPNRPTEVRYGFESPIDTKHFTGDWWKSNQRQLDLVLEEISHWDGNISGSEGGDICFNTTSKRDADFIQYAAHACSRVATISVYPTTNERHSELYKVHISHPDSPKSSVTLRGDAVTIGRIPGDRMYCFTVPTGFWLARHDGNVFITGNSAGGGKSDLLLGLGLTQHTRSIIYRREGTQNLALIDRLLGEIVRDRKGWNGKDNVWRGNGRQIEFGACKDLGDEQKYQGRAHDLKGFDEITHFLESQFRFLMGWLRSSKPGQRKRIVCTGNPPTNQDGQWVKDFWGAWLDPNHPNPAQPGELRWYTTIDGKDTECESGEPFMHNGKMIQPLSRTFIPSRVTDNVFMMDAGYEAILQALPEPLRSQMLNGDFSAGTEDSPWQVCPTAWVQAAMDRWTEEGKKGEMDSMGVDVARGGRDKTVIATRYGQWYAPLKRYPGKDTPDGPIVAGLAIAEQKDSAPIHVDVIGPGGSVIDHLRGNDIQVVGINGSAKSPEYATDKSGHLKFRNMRAWLHWSFREALDPKTGKNIMLPPDSKLKADLCTPTWKLTAQGIQVESKDDVIERLGRSPDDGDAVIYCSMETPKMLRTVKALMDTEKEEGSYNPLYYGLKERR